MSRNRSYRRNWVMPSAHIRFAGDDLDPNEVTRLLALEPDGMGWRGDSHSYHKTFGRMPTSCPRPTSYWVLSSYDEVDSIYLQLHIEWVLSQLEPIANRVRLLARRPNVTATIGTALHGRYDLFPRVPEELYDRSESLGLELKIDWTVFYR